jgi:hypothetical protein
VSASRSRPGNRSNVFRAAYGLFYGSTPALIPALANVSERAIIDPSFKTARVHQASAGWEVEKYRAGTVGIAYLFARGERLPRAVDSNIDGRFAGIDRMVSLQSSGQSLYNGRRAARARPRSSAALLHHRYTARDPTRRRSSQSARSSAGLTSVARLRCRATR